MENITLSHVRDINLCCVGEEAYQTLCKEQGRLWNQWPSGYSQEKDALLLKLRLEGEITIGCVSHRKRVAEQGTYHV